MRSLNLGVLAAALAGLAGAFLPLSHDLSWWARRAGPDGASVYFVIGAFAVALVVGARGLARGFERWLALVALICFGFVILKFRLDFFGLFTSQLGGQLLGVGAGAGLALAGLAAWRAGSAPGA